MSQPSDGQQSNQPFQSQYPELKIPEHGFISNIPQHLLENCDPQMTWLLNEVSKNTAATEFACRGAVDLSAHLRALNGKTFRNEKKLIENIEEVAKVKEEQLELKTQLRSMKPIVGTLSSLKILFTNKLFLAILALATMFLLGMNRDVLFKIAKFFLEP